MVTAGLVLGGAQVLSGLFASSQASKQAAAERKRKEELTRKLNQLENSRQPIINPFDGAEDLSSTFSNSMANLGVATQAAEMQAEEADISLANTLDTIRSTGASAGGATALAQAALQSKKSVSAGIEQQEAQNEKLRAQGEDRLQDQVAGEKIRMQNVDAQGKSFVFGQQENREMTQLDRVQAQITGAAQAESQARSDANGAITSAIGGAASSFGQAYGAYKGAQG
jgi:hypothetical protein